jgi:hypothetical protein
MVFSGTADEMSAAELECEGKYELTSSFYRHFASRIVLASAPIILVFLFILSCIERSFQVHSLQAPNWANPLKILGLLRLLAR